MASDKNNPPPERDEFDVDVVPGQRRGAHRTQSPPAVVAILAALAALLVVALIVTVVGMTGLGTPDPDDVAVQPSTATEELPLQTAEPIQPAIDKGASITVLNATRVRNISTRVKGELENEGWIVNRTGNNEDRSLSATVVQYSDPELEQTAQALVDLLGGGVIQQVPEDEMRDTEDLRALIGQTYAVAHNLATSSTSTTSSRTRSTTSTRSRTSDDESGTSTSTRSGSRSSSDDETSTSTRTSTRSATSD